MLPHVYSLIIFQVFEPQKTTVFIKPEAPKLADLALEARSRLDNGLQFNATDRKALVYLSEESIIARTKSCTSYFDRHIFPYGSTQNVRTFSCRHTVMELR